MYTYLSIYLLIQGCLAPTLINLLLSSTTRVFLSKPKANRIRELRSHQKMYIQNFTFFVVLLKMRLYL